MQDTLSPTRSLESETQAALSLGVSPRTLQAWRCRGDGPAFIKVGRAVRYDRAELDRFLTERTRTSTAGGAA